MRRLLREFTRVGWHVDGMSWEAYQRLTLNERWALHAEIDDLIERTDTEDNGAGLGHLARPKAWRK